MKQQENLQITPEMAAHDEAAHACKRVWPSHSEGERWAKRKEKSSLASAKKKCRRRRLIKNTFLVIDKVSMPIHYRE